MSLAQRSVRSSVYNVGANLIQTVVLAVRSILLARLLSPEDFGVYAFAGSLVIITSSLPNFGMGSAFVHRAKESEGEDALRVYFTLAFFFNIIWGGIISAFGFMVFEPDYYWVLLAILITKITLNLANVGRARLVKRVVFRRIALVDTVVVLMATVFSLFFAVKGYGIWSLVSTDVIAALVVVVGFYIYRPIWHPRFGWATETVHYFINFGKRTFMAGILGQALDKVDDLWTGILLGETSLGYYSRAYNFATYPRKILAAPLNAVAGGAYAELKDQPKRLSQAFFLVNAFLIRSGFFFGGVMALIAPEFIHLVIGDKWLPMLTAFRLMLIYTLLDPIRGTIASLFTALGYPEKVTKVRLIQLVVLLIGLFALASNWGISGVAISVNIMLLVGIALLMWQAKGFIKFSIPQLFFAPSCALIVGLIIAWGAVRILNMPDSHLLTVGMKIISLTVFYFALLYLMEKERLNMIYQDLRKKFFSMES